MEALMKKTDELSLAKTLEFAAQCYTDKKTSVGIDVFPFCKQVARQAEKIAKRLYLDLKPEYISDSAQDTITAIVHCAILHDVLNQSTCAFENIAEITNVQIAAMVAAISRDFRLVETKRDMEFRGRLSQSPVGAQIVVVAHIICTANTAINLLETSGIKSLPKSKKMLAQMDGDLLAIRAADKYYVVRLYTQAARNMLLTISQKIKSCKQQAKIEKMVLQNTKTLRESAEQAEKPETVKPRKKREKRYATKRTPDNNSE
ncbi:MAG: hypothetical protein EBZ69_00030 [Alphaproteobacteria bacterium]|nr:hypothetical protein [Alphaproteobacteria bacterium]NDG04020.1 hypothetical protein [Alphaproteobacteria bacterium]